MKHPINPRASSIKVDGVEVEVTWHDYGSFLRLHVQKDGKMLGHRDMPIPVDTGNGVVEYIVKSVLRGGRGKYKS